MGFRVEGLLTLVHCTVPSREEDSMREAVLTVFPKIVYFCCRCPTSPPTTGPDVRSRVTALGGYGLGFGVWGLGFGVWGVRFRVWGLGSRVWGLGFRVSGLGFRVQGSGFRVQGLGFRV